MHGPREGFRERVLFIGTQFSILYTSMYSPAEAATLVSYVAPNGAAQRSNSIKVGDVLVAFDGKFVERMKSPDIPSLLLGLEGSRSLSLFLSLSLSPSWPRRHQVSLLLSSSCPSCLSPSCR